MTIVFDDNVTRLVAKYRRKGLLIDTNLCLLLVVGTCRASRIATFKRTMIYTRRDFNLLRSLCSLFEVRTTTPNILTEVDNLGRQLPSAEHLPFSDAFRDIGRELLEEHRTFGIVHTHPRFAKLGVADTVSLILSQENLLLSDDLPLCSHVLQSGGDAINFNHLRR